MAEEKKTAEAIKREVTHLKKLIEVLKEQAREQGQAFSSLEEDQLTKKVQGETSKSPFIFAQSWTSGTTLGSAANYTVHVRNPDPVAYSPVYATIFFGLGNFFGADRPGRDGISVGQSSRLSARSSLRTQTAVSASITQFPRGCLLELTTETRWYGGASGTMSVPPSIGAAST